MAEESFMLVSLKEGKAKKLAQVISNDTCLKILDALSKKNATETELSKILTMPLSTVHYNIQHLVENKLVIAEEFHYSEKGKEVLHYKLANKLIIIAPAATEEGFLEKLKTILPVGIVTLAATASIAFFYKMSNSFGKITNDAAMPLAARSMKTATLVAAESGTESFAMQSQDFAYGASQSTPAWQISLWFLAGAVFVTLTYLLVRKLREGKQGK
jgi:predicted transcriptional regulator